MTHEKLLRRRVALCLAALCLLLTLLPGCSTPRRPQLWYEDCIESVTVTEGGRTWEITKIPGGSAVTLSSVGITYRLTDTEQTVSAGDVTIPVTDAVTATARMAAAMLSLTECVCTQVKTDAPGHITAHYETAEGEITVHFGEAGLPVSFETPLCIFTVTDCRLKDEAGKTANERG